MEKLEKAVWIWCEFSSRDTKHLTELQNEVRNKLGGPEFKIHMTLAGPFDYIESSSIQEIRDYCHEHSPIKVGTLRYDYNDNFFQSLFIVVDQSKQLDDLRNAIFKISHQNSTKNFYPHISLAYGNHGEEVKANLIPFLPSAKKTMVIDTLSIMDIDKDISLWKASRSFSFNSVSKI